MCVCVCVCVCVCLCSGRNWTERLHLSRPNSLLLLFALQQARAVVCLGELSPIPSKYFGLLLPNKLELWFALWFASWAAWSTFLICCCQRAWAVVYLGELSCVTKFMICCCQRAWAVVYLGELSCVITFFALLYLAVHVLPSALPVCIPHQIQRKLFIILFHLVY